MELLSPAGSYESLIAAVQSGADAVYLGGYKFGARQSAVNFQLPDMKKWIDYCHLYGVKVYITVNTLIKDSELEEFASYITDLAKINADGVIVQDIGALTIIQTVAPGLEIHASTQMTVTSPEDALFLENLGFSRIVLSRELSAEEIKCIRNTVSCELEVFVHGALCMSYSGQCLMSSIIGGRSGNRGRCAQPCRLPYTLVGDKNTSGFLLSPKDLCLIDHIEQLRQAGVDSLKVEGRLKRAGYVSTVIGIYRACIDNGRKATPDEKNQLQNAFGRGFTGGFFCGDTGDNMMNFENSSNAAENVFTKDAIDRCLYDANFRKVHISIEADAEVGRPFSVKMTDDVGNVVRAQSDSLCEKAINIPTDEERIKKALLKLGDTVYVCDNISVRAHKDVSIPVSVINATRRLLCENMNSTRIERKPLTTYSFTRGRPCQKTSNPQIFCEVNTIQQYNVAKKLGIKNIVAPAVFGTENDIIRSPFVSKSGYAISKYIMASNTGQLYNAGECEIVGSHRLNITNYLSAEFYVAFMERGILSPELTLKEISDIVGSSNLNCGIIGYGRVDLMLCANCFLKAAGKCQKQGMVYSLKDRKSEKFPLICAEDCAVRILNSKPIFMADKWNEIANTGVGFVNLVFTVENSDECEIIIRKYQDAQAGKKVESMIENTFTRGHFYRGVL